MTKKHFSEFLGKTSTLGQKKSKEKGLTGRTRIIRQKVKVKGKKCLSQKHKESHKEAMNRQNSTEKPTNPDFAI